MLVPYLSSIDHPSKFFLPICSWGPGRRACHGWFRAGIEVSSPLSLIRLYGLLLFPYCLLITLSLYCNQIAGYFGFIWLHRFCYILSRYIIKCKIYISRQGKTQFIIWNGGNIDEIKLTYLIFANTFIEKVLISAYIS